MRHWKYLASAVLLIGATAPATPIDALKLNQVRMLGSHNSYRSYPSAAEEARIKAAGPQYWPSLAYGHPPLETQLKLGLHQFEIDVAADQQGGAYAAPYAHSAPAIRALMAAPGAKVLHFPNVDTEVHCLTFRTCLGIFARWSDAHPDHAPIVILVNASDFPTVPKIWPRETHFDQAAIDALNDDIAAVIGARRVLTPDEVRGTHATLREGVLAGDWPTLARLRGRFIFVLDGSGAHEQYLRAGHPSLRGRLMFGWFDEDQPEAAVFNIQDPVAERARITRLVQQGFIVRTRADADVVEARAHDGRRMQAALASGAQVVSTDFYAGAPDPQGLGYVADFAGPMLRCDEVTATCPEKK